MTSQENVSFAPGFPPSPVSPPDFPFGHRNIQHTVRYTATNPARFEKLWR